MKVFNASENGILEMLCDPKQLSNVISLPFEYDLLNMTDLSMEFCNADVARQIKNSFDISSVIYQVGTVRLLQLNMTFTFSYLIKNEFEFVVCTEDT